MRLLVVTVIASTVFGWFISQQYYQRIDQNLLSEDLNLTIETLKEQLEILTEKNNALENDQQIRLKTEPLFKVERGQLTEEEMGFLEQVRSANFDIEIPDSVTRNYVFENGIYQLKNTVFNYDLGDNFLYFDAYPYYNINLKTTDHMLVLEYNISAGTALTSFGAVMYNTINKEIINNNYSFGTSAGTSEVFVDGVEYYTNHQEFE